MWCGVTGEKGGDPEILERDSGMATSIPLLNPKNFMLSHCVITNTVLGILVYKDMQLECTSVMNLYACS